MLRRSIVLTSITLSFLVILWFAFGRSTATVKAGALPQAIIGQTLSQPVSMTVRQQIPFTFTLLTSEVITQGETLTDSVSRVISQTIALTFDVEMAVVINASGRTTTPVTIRLASRPPSALDFPVESTLVLARNLLAQIDSELLPPPTPTATPTNEPTATATLTPTLEVTPTVAVTVTESVSPTDSTPATNATTVITANLRSGPSLEAEIVGQLGPDVAINAVAQSADQNWLLLNDGNFVSVLVLDAIPANLPTATDALLASIRANQLAITATATLTATPAAPEPTIVLTPTVEVTATVAPTLEATATAEVTATVETTSTTAISPTSLVNANLRAGPGVEFELLGGTVTGQVLTVVGRNADASWLRLDNTGWVRADLVANAPLSNTVQLVNNDGSPVAAPVTPLALPTATPRAPAPTATQLPTATPAPTVTPASGRLSVVENLYVRTSEAILDAYGDTMTQIGELVGQATTDKALLEDEDWQLEMQTAVEVLRQTGQEVRGLNAPSRFRAANEDLVTAATNFDTAASYFETGVTGGATAQFEEGFAQANLGESALADFEKKLNALKPG